MVEAQSLIKHRWIVWKNASMDSSKFSKQGSRKLPLAQLAAELDPSQASFWDNEFAVLAQQSAATWEAKDKKP